MNESIKSVAESLMSNLPSAKVYLIGSSVCDAENAKDVDLLCIVDWEGTTAVRVTAFEMLFVCDNKLVDVKVMSTKLATRRGYFSGPNIRII